MNNNLGHNSQNKTLIDFVITGTGRDSNNEKNQK